MDEAHQMYFNELRDSKELDQALQWFDTRDREYFQCRTRINEVLQCAEKQISNRMSLVSSRSSTRSSSSIRSKRAKAAARAACLEVESRNGFSGKRSRVQYLPAYKNLFFQI